MGHSPTLKPKYASLPKIEAYFVILPFVPRPIPYSLTPCPSMEVEPWSNIYGIKK
jgi:hypothetical protein